MYGAVSAWSRRQWAYASRSGRRVIARHCGDAANPISASAPVLPAWCSAAEQRCAAAYLAGADVYRGRQHRLRTQHRRRGLPARQHALPTHASGRRCSVPAPARTAASGASTATATSPSGSAPALPSARIITCTTISNRRCGRSARRSRLRP